MSAAADKVIATILAQLPTPPTGDGSALHDWAMRFGRMMLAEKAQPAPEPTNERAAFENWAADQAAITSEPDCWARHRFGGDYVYQKVEMAWRAWRDGRAAGRADAQPAEPDDSFEYTMSCLIDYATGGRASKPCTPLAVLKGLIDDHVTSLVDERIDDEWDEVKDLFRIWQSNLGASRDQCDDTGRKLWDRIDDQLAARAEKGGT